MISAALNDSPAVDVPAQPGAGAPGALAVHGPARTKRARRAKRRLVLSQLAMQNVRMLGLLERIAERFEAAGVPLMALKGAALHLVLFDRPDARPMSDLDLLVRPQDANRACLLLERLGGLRGEPLVREDFFPTYHYELEYTVGALYPVRIDLHVRPFRPLRYARLLPDDALWNRTVTVPIGRSRICVPAAEEMLIHLVVHAAVHGGTRRLWLDDIRSWLATYGSQLDWERLLGLLERWTLTHPFRAAMRFLRARSPEIPPNAWERLGCMSVSWRDRLALWQAPRDAEHSLFHLLVNVLCTPGVWFKLGYLRANLLPSRVHMADWYGPPHRGWLMIAHLLRWLGPLVTRTRLGRRCLSRIEVRRSTVHGLGVFANRAIRAGEVIAHCAGRPVHREGMYVVTVRDNPDLPQRMELTGKLRFLNHSCGPNARLSGLTLIAFRDIRADDEITIDYGPAACDCDRNEVQLTKDGHRRPAARVA